MARSPKQVAAIEKQIVAGNEARQILDRSTTTCRACGSGTSVFAEREQQIIREAIQWFETPSAASDSHVAVRYIAALAEIVKLRDALEFRVRKADEATVALHAGA